MGFLNRLNEEILNEYGLGTGSTSTKNKVDIVEPAVFDIMKEIAYAESDEYAITLVGPEDGLQRHIDEFKSIGIPPERLIIVESDEDIYKQLQARQSEYGFELVNSDYMDVVKDKISKGIKISFLDFDATSTMSQYEINMVKFFNENKSSIKAMRIVGSARKRKGEEKESFETLSDELGEKPFYKPRFMTTAEKRLILQSSNASDKVRNQMFHDFEIANDKEKKSTHDRKIVGKGYRSDSDILSLYAESLGLHAIFGFYKGRSNMSNILIAQTDLKRFKKTTYKKADGSDFTFESTDDFNRADFKRIKLPGKEKAISFYTGSINRYKPNGRYWALENSKEYSIYHKTDGTLFKKSESQQLSKMFFIFNMEGQRISKKRFTSLKKAKEFLSDNNFGIISNQKIIKRSYEDGMYFVTKDPESNIHSRTGKEIKHKLFAINAVSSKLEFDNGIYVKKENIPTINIGSVEAKSHQYYILFDDNGQQVLSDLNIETEQIMQGQMPNSQVVVRVINKYIGEIKSGTASNAIAKETPINIKTDESNFYFVISKNDKRVKINDDGTFYVKEKDIFLRRNFVPKEWTDDDRIITFDLDGNVVKKDNGKLAIFNNYEEAAVKFFGDISYSTGIRNVIIGRHASTGSKSSLNKNFIFKYLNSKDVDKKAGKYILVNKHERVSAIKQSIDGTSIIVFKAPDNEHDLPTATSDDIYPSARTAAEACGVENHRGVNQVAGKPLKNSTWRNKYIFRYYKAIDTGEIKDEDGIYKIDINPFKYKDGKLYIRPINIRSKELFAKFFLNKKNNTFTFEGINTAIESAKSLNLVDKDTILTNARRADGKFVRYEYIFRNIKDTEAMDKISDTEYRLKQSEINWILGINESIFSKWGRML